MNAPWGLDARLKLVALACSFFDARRMAANHKAIGKKVAGKEGVPEPLTMEDFLKYVDVIGLFAKKPNAFRAVGLVEEMASAGLLVYAGSSGKRLFAGLQNSYIYMATGHERRRDLFRLVPVLGPEYLYKLCAPGLIHITGTKRDGDVASGTGLVIGSSHVLTCGHVVRDMELDREQRFQGRKCIVNEASIHAHPDVDIAVVEVDGERLSPLKGALFQTPVVAQTVYTLGYPRLPGLRDASVIMQPGTVTSESVTSLAGESLFLYSAVARPGNSGGPVVSRDGYIVGLSIVDATAEYHPNEAFSPHYAGIPAEIVAEAVAGLGLGVELPFETYE